MISDLSLLGKCLRVHLIREKNNLSGHRHNFKARNNIAMFYTEYLMLQKYSQAGANLGQAQLKLGLDFTLIVCRFSLYRFFLIVLVGLI